MKDIWGIDLVAREAEREKRKQAWLMKRRSGITGTDVSKILGRSHWGNASDILRDKLGESSVQENDHMRLGRLLEDDIVEMAQEDNPFNSIRQSSNLSFDANAMIRNGIFLCNTDGFVDEDGILECKVTSSESYKKYWDKLEIGPNVIKLPYDYYYQANHYMGNCWKKHTLFCILHRDTSKMVYSWMKFDQGEFERVSVILTKWWESAWPQIRERWDFPQDYREVR